MVYFIILHYMVSDETISCVDSIMRIKGNKKIIIVDNCSPNGSYEVIKHNYQNEDSVIVLKSLSNGGYAAGINFGYDFIKKNFNDIEFIVAMNNDMVIEQSDFEEKISDIYNETDFYVLGPDIYSTSNRIHQNPGSTTIRTLEKIESELKRIDSISLNKIKTKSFLKKFPFVNQLYSYVKYRNKRKSSDYLEPKEDITLHGSCLIFSKYFIENRDYIFYPKTKFYCEAQILDYQCHKNNWKRVYSPRITVLHNEDVATNASYDSYINKALFMNQCMRDSLIEFKKLVLSNSEGKSK